MFRRAPDDQYRPEAPTTEDSRAASRRALIINYCILFPRDIYWYSYSISKSMNQFFPKIRLTREAIVQTFILNGGVNTVLFRKPPLRIGTSSATIHTSVITMENIA